MISTTFSPNYCTILQPHKRASSKIHNLSFCLLLPLFSLAHCFMARLLEILLLPLMESCEMKIVSAGIKAFERHPSKSSEVEYRLTQDAVNIVAPHMTKRKVTATAQDFCNLLGGGLVSFATLSDGLVTDLNKLSTGTFVCTYTYRDEDVVAGQGAVNGNPGEKQRQQAFHLVCFKGSTRAVNVMCHKLDIEKYRHQLSSLGVYREKIKASSATEDTTGKAEPVEQTTTEPEK